MRSGENPVKSDHSLVTNYNHRVIIPVYIPNLNGYFADGLKILKICLESLLHTIDDQTAVTIINNASCSEVSEYIKNLFDDGRIDALLNYRENKGKIDSVMSVIRGSYEPFITISDADVLFLNGWLEAVNMVFSQFPNAGMVSPTYIPNLYKSFNSSTWLYGLLRRRIKKIKFKNNEGVLKFYESVGWDIKKNKKYLLHNYALFSRDRSFYALIGCGHFVATYRKEVFTFSPSYPIYRKLPNGMENYYIDIPVDIGGYLRLATSHNYTYHLGNKYENWMNESFNKIISQKNQIKTADRVITKQALPVFKLPSFYRLKNKIVRFFIPKL